MKIVLDLQGAQSHSRHRGIGRYSLSMAKAFAEAARHHEVWLALNGLHGDSAMGLVEQFDGLIPRERIAVSVLPANIAGCVPANRARIVQAGAAYSAFLSGLNADCVWHGSLFEGWGDDSVSTLGGGIDDSRHVATLYDLIPLLNPQRYLHDPAYSRWYYQRLGLLKRCGLLLAISESARKEAIDHLQCAGDNIVVVSGAPHPVFKPTPPDAVRQARWRQEWNLTTKFVLYTGGFDAHKNVDGLVAAYSDLPIDVRARHSLVLAGRCGATEMKRLTELGRHLHLARGNLIFTGDLTDDDLVALYSSCAVFVAPSLHEGLGLPPLEAMACGAAVIGSNSTSLPEVIGAADALFDPLSRSSIAGMLLEALVNPVFAAWLRAHGHRQAARFDWATSAGRAVEAIERHLNGAKVRQSNRPKLMYMSPLPPTRSGISDYSSSLLRELASHYEIELVLDQPELLDPWAQANFPVHSWRRFASHVDGETRFLYHFGNSPFHAYMFAMLRQHPGVVMLHDSWLGAARNWMANEAGEPDQFLRQLYDSHGYAALRFERLHGRQPTLDAFPVNLDVLQDAAAVIVHSTYAVAQAHKHYGAVAAAKFSVVPFPKAASPGSRERARLVLGFKPDDVVVCSFGMLAPTKLNHRLIKAWLKSSLASDARCHLFFVGENDGGLYGSKLQQAIKTSEYGARIHITGFATPDRYADYLAASDIAVQLRTASRAETSAAIFDALAMGVPLVVNGHGPAAELPADVAVCLPDQFDDDALKDALQHLNADEKSRAAFSLHSKRWISTGHSPAAVARDYRDVIEAAFSEGASADKRRSIGAATRGTAAGELASDERENCRKLLAANRPRLDRPRLFVDVTAIEKSHLHTGIERVVRGVLLELLKLEQSGYRVEPVKLVAGLYRHASAYTLKLLSLPDIGLAEQEAVPYFGDILLGLDWVADLVPVNQALLDDWRTRGVRVVFVVYDLLPVQMPDAFPPDIAPMHEAWLQSIGRHADALLCISKCVADDVREWFDRHTPARRNDLALGYFYPGADLVATRPSEGLPEGAAEHLRSMQTAPTFVMVGTVEPRKGHAFVLDAFETLWSEGVHVNLLIVGRRGWMSDALSERLRSHSRAGEKLEWLEQVSDEYLEKIYDASTGLIAASLAEGFGLPLVEASRRGLPVIARDIPVFREVSGSYPTYFDGRDPASLVAILQRAVLSHPSRASFVPQAPLSWQTTTARLWDMLFDAHHAQWLPAWKMPER